MNLGYKVRYTALLLLYALSNAELLAKQLRVSTPCIALSSTLLFSACNLCLHLLVLQPVWDSVQAWKCRVPARWQRPAEPRGKPRDIL